MKIFKYFLILLFTNIQFIVAEPHCIGFGELIFYNYYADGVTVKVIPEGSIFSGHSSYITTGNEYKYSFRPCYRSTNAGTNWTYVVGGSRTISLLPPGFPPVCETNSGGYAVFDWDDGGNYLWNNYFHPDVCVGAVSYGLWVVEFWWTPSEDSPPTLINSCKIDYRDWRAPRGCNELNSDLFVKLTSDNNIYFFWGNAIDQEFEGSWIPITNELVPDRTIQWFRQVLNLNGVIQINQCPDGQNNGNFLTSNTDGGYWLNLPIDAHALNSNYIHLNPELIDMNLSVATNMTANILPGKTLTITNQSTFALLQNSVLNIPSNSILLLKNGSRFCNYGGTVNGSNIVYERRGLFTYCSYYDGVIKGGNLTIEDSAIVEFPDSTTLTFESTSKLIMKPHSEIRMGRYSKIIFEDGSSISCDSAKITSLDSTQTWDGIYLDGVAYDTLKNCTFQNAENGINITDNYNPFGSPGAVEISNCTFKNSTSSDLLNYVYVNNSYNVLVKGCNSEKTGSGGFTSGIIAEYCPTNGVVIADNNINYVTTGISLLQSTEYIGRNTITGSTNSGTGIYLDNSNGTIEYNTVNNFQKSVYGSYSSPYMLKNTLYDASLTNIDLVDGSMPVMKPVISSSTLRWLGGNNTISGFPSNSGIRFADCYPLMDSGYNKIVVNGSDYMNGNFTFSITTVPARLNYWFDSPPISSLFNISSGNVNSSNPFNGSSLPSTDGTELNSLGWGMYDTVFTKSLGDNSTAEDLFMQAYTEEMSQNYTDAVTHYKEVVSSYKSSSYAPVSLSRIFNCLEKSHATSSDYQSIQTYYNSIKSNSVYPNESRELSEDFVIKSKVKQGSIEEAVSDYNAIYQANQNNSKGLHALLNKYCLENMVQGDNSSGNSTYENHKINILSLITGENIRSNNQITNNTPKQFRLLQNYPNPFNPVTNIKYEIPKDVNVIIKIYDILGKEVFSYNEYKKAGSYEVQFDGTNLASGMYFYKLTADNPSTGSGREFTDTKKMVLLK